jgi:pyrroloquinoline quinone biosynthesis protein B
METNGPWSQLITLNNIELINSKPNNEITLSNDLRVTPIQVPHRDEFSETVGFKIVGTQKSALFIPDIDKWSKWGEDITQEIAGVDLALLDATFYDGDEINNRDISEIPHPFVIETMDVLQDLPESEKAKVHFIHFNHTNPLLDENSEASKTVKQRGFNIARTGMKFGL